jgi:subtilisin family serine protease
VEGKGVSCLFAPLPTGIDRVQAPLVWEAGYEGEGITVCIIDTGLYRDHEDLLGITNVIV